MLLQSASARFMRRSGPSGSIQPSLPCLSSVPAGLCSETRVHVTCSVAGKMPRLGLETFPSSDLARVERCGLPVVQQRPTPSPADRPPMLLPRTQAPLRAALAASSSRTAHAAISPAASLNVLDVLRASLAASSPNLTFVRHATHQAQGRANGPKNGPGKRLGAKKTGGTYICN